MPWAIERGGIWHSPGGWRGLDAAARYDTAEDAHAAREELERTTLAWLKGELHVKEVEQ